MDDGSPIQLKITIDADKGEAVFDFEGTGPEVYGNTNAPQAVTYSAIIYCLRSLISEDIPLNQGCLKPITVLIPPKSFLSPPDKAAVVGGNVLTSQRVTDVILKAFRACCRLPRRLQQSNFRLRRQRRWSKTRQGIRLLRDDCRGQRSGSQLGRHKWSPYAHDEYADHRRRSIREALPGPAPRIFAPGRQWRGGKTQGWGWRGAGHRVSDSRASFHLEREEGVPTVWTGGRRGCGVRTQYLGAEGGEEWSGEEGSAVA
ncbi:hypothetical protein EYC84_001633 [Monilinia fructicola]|nr:hypothetical protein EYC84_001633 [Monilinia fructicola]